MFGQGMFWKWFVYTLVFVGAVALFVRTGHGLIITAVLGFLVMTALLAILARSLARIVRDTKQAKEEIPTILAMLSLAIAALWISQGVLATQVNIKLKAMAAQPEEIKKDAEDSKARTLLTVSLALENTGIRQTQIKYMSLFVCPDGCPDWNTIFDANVRKDRGIELRNLIDLGFGKPTQAEFEGNADGNYVLTWGTQESRQIAILMKKADFYDVRFSLGTKEVGTPMVNKWRSSTIVTMDDRWVKKDFTKSGRAGESMDQDHTSSEHKSTFELLKRFLGVGGV